MAVTITSPVIGGAQTGFTSPTYTLIADIAPSPNGKQYAVSALGGTQASVDVHSVSKPFTVTVYKPAVLRVLPPANPVTGVIKAVPKNHYKIIVRKAASPAANQPNIPFTITCDIEVPAGVDTYEPEEVRAAISLMVGTLYQISAGLGDTTVSGVL